MYMKIERKSTKYDKINKLSCSQRRKQTMLWSLM